jgi:chromosome partitioning protein
MAVEMGLFNKKTSDGRHDGKDSPQAQNLESEGTSAPASEAWGFDPERQPGRAGSPVQQDQPLSWEEPATAPAPVQPTPAPAAPVPVEAAAPKPSVMEELTELDAIFEAPAKPAAAPAAAEADQSGTLEKEELRRAVTAGMGDGDEDNRLSADAAMAPTMKRKHPFAPAPVEPASERHVKIFALANQKGGVAKTTTTLNLAVALSESGHRVLCVDLDPQGNLTMSQGIDPDTVEKSLYHVLVEKMPIREIIQHREIDIAVSSIDLAGAEIAMSTQIGRERSLQKALAQVSDDYDFVCIDTPPSLGLLTINALTAADKVIVPVQCEYLSMRGLVQLQNTLEMIRENLNPDVQIEGILPTMLDTRTIHAKEAVEILEENFGELVFKSRIKKAIKFAEAPVKGSSVLKYDPRSNAAQCYRDLAEEVLTHGTT